jgi:HEAT repeats
MSDVTEILEALRNGDFDTAIPRARALPVTAFPEVAALLEQAADSHDRQLCYTILTKIAITSRSSAIGTYAAKRVELESDVKFKLRALELVMWTKYVEEYGSVLSALDHKNPDVRRAAIEALGGCVGDKAEVALLNVLENDNKPGISQLAAVGLARMCSQNASERIQSVFLQTPRKKPNETTLACLVFACLRHPNEQFTKIVREELESTRLWMLGWACLNYLSVAGDTSDSTRVRSYLKNVFGRLKRGVTVYDYTITLIEAPFRTEISAALAAILNFQSDPPLKCLEILKSNWTKLSSRDQSWLQATYPADFDGLIPDQQT